MEIVKSIKQNTYIKNIIYVLMGSILLTISAKIKIPFYPVPMTMQTFVVLFLGVILGSKLGALSVTLYLVEGIIGLPVFSNTPEKGIGIVYFTGPTMGYLVGFIFASYIAGLINLKTNIIIIFIKLVFTVSIIYFCGIAWLGFLIGWEKPIFDLGAKPFLLAEIFKILILTLLTKYLLGLKKFI